MTTFKEKLQQEHPEEILVGGSCRGCPEEYGYEEPINCAGMGCDDCWDREMKGEHYEV